MSPQGHQPVRAKALHWRDFRRPPIVWLSALLMAICFEGLGRKYLTAVPSVAFYFLKDMVLIAGLFYFGVNKRALKPYRRFLGPFAFVVFLAVGWTFLNIFNPASESLALGALGFRAYWLWWLAPIAIASALHDENDGQRMVWILAIVTAVVASMAILQFISGADSGINVNASYQGELMRKTDIVRTTARARVSATFSFFSGFNAFTSTIPCILLAFGLSAKGRRTQLVSLASILAAIAVLPMSGSRSSIVLSGLACVLVLVGAGIMRSKGTRRAALAMFAAVFFAVAFSGEAVQGVADRFKLTKVSTRVDDMLSLLPPYAIVVHRYPALGEGTGMMQNARFSFATAYPKYYHEGEPGKMLVEQGVLGYLLVWGSRFGLCLALVRMCLYLRKRKKHGAAGAALALSALAFLGNTIFDHVWQALLFFSIGLVVQQCAMALQEERDIKRRRRQQRAQAMQQASAASTLRPTPH